MDTSIVVVPSVTSSFEVTECLKLTNRYIISARKTLLLSTKDAQFIFLSQQSLLNSLNDTMDKYPIEFLLVKSEETETLPELPGSAFAIPSTQINDVLEFVFDDLAKPTQQNTNLCHLVDTQNRLYVDNILEVVSPALEELLKIVERKNLIKNPDSSFNALEWLGAYLLKTKRTV
ncbi:hypothetical protein GEMRC1_006560 [Eukaryota sp. GEM-RC1]